MTHCLCWHRTRIVHQASCLEMLVWVQLSAWSNLNWMTICLCQSRVVNCAVAPSILHAWSMQHALSGLLLACHSELVMVPLPPVHHTHLKCNIASLLSTYWATLLVIGHTLSCTCLVYQACCWALPHATTYSHSCCTLPTIPRIKRDLVSSVLYYP